MKTVFFRVLEAEDKAVALLEAIRKRKSTFGRKRFELEAAAFRQRPAISVCLLGERKRRRRMFLACRKWEDNGRTIKVGVQTFKTTPASCGCLGKSAFVMIDQSGFSLLRADPTHPIIPTCIFLLIF